MPRRPPGPADVIVPVHGAAPEFARCLASLGARTELTHHRLVVVLDGAGQLEAEQALDDMAGRAGTDLVVLRNPTRRGYVASVNRGMAHSRRDVVLLNSDTVVTENWLDKLQAAAYSAADIATVTPFSNNATICSIPRFLAVNAIPSGHDVDSFARLVERCATREYPRIPTGVGVCLYVRRHALDALGAFDEARFGLGYGEETDFCLRAVKAGYVNVLDDATFVYHAGQRSFGTSRAARVRIAERRMRRRHPEYRATIGQFIREDPLRDTRRRILRALRPDRDESAERARVLHIVHGWPPFNHAGTEIYARELALRQAGRRDVTVYGRIADPHRTMGETTELIDHRVRVRLAVNNFTQRDPLSRNALRNRVLESDFRRLLDEVQPELVHVHHLAGHCAGLLRTAWPASWPCTPGRSRGRPRSRASRAPGSCRRRLPRRRGCPCGA